MDTQNKKSLRKLFSDWTLVDTVRQGLIAAIYVTITLMFAPISFMAIQFRIAEGLMVLPFYSKKNIIGLTIGCLIANIYSPIGLADIIFGTLATLIACMLVYMLKTKKLVALACAIVNGLIVGALLHFVYGLPFVLSVVYVAAGEFVVVQLSVLLSVTYEKTYALIKRTQ